jgi:hypothetical protein
MTNSDEFHQTDSFEEKLRKLIPNFTEADLIRGADQVAYMCKCATCPSNQGTGENKVVFCNLGKTTLIQEKKGCLCRECPNTHMMSFRWDYYCIQGSAYNLSETEKTNNIVLPLLGTYE